MNPRSIFALLLAAIVAAQFASPAPRASAADGPADAPAQTPETKPAADPAAASVTNSTAKTNATVSRKIMANDVLAIRVVGEPELTVNTRVSGAGTITYPFIGSVPVEGKTTLEVEKILRLKLEDGYLVKPEVIVDVEKFNEETITVLGAVGRGGVVVLPSNRKIDLVEAIGLAGDLTRLAKRSHIELKRNGETRVFTYDKLKDASTDETKKIFVEPGDVIFVKERIL